MGWLQSSLHRLSIHLLSQGRGKYEMQAIIRPATVLDVSSLLHMRLILPLRQDHLQVILVQFTLAPPFQDREALGWLIDIAQALRFIHTLSIPVVHQVWQSEPGGNRRQVVKSP